MLLVFDWVLLDWLKLEWKFWDVEEEKEFESETKYLLDTLKRVFLVTRLLTVNRFGFIELDGKRISKETITELRKIQKHNILKKELLEIPDILGIRIPMGLKDIDKIWTAEYNDEKIRILLTSPNGDGSNLTKPKTNKTEKNQ